MNKEDTLKITVKGTYGYSFYVPMVTIHYALCRKDRALSRRKWGHRNMGHVILHDPSVWLTTPGLSPKPKSSSNKGQLTERYSVGIIILFGW